MLGGFLVLSVVKNFEGDKGDMRSIPLEVLIHAPSCGALQVFVV